MSLSQIRYFVTVAEEGTVARAAQRLYIAQPAVSRQVRALEDELGTPLFSRTPRGMSLLSPGRVFLDHARAILAAVDHAADAARAEGASLPPRSPPPTTPPRRGQREVPDVPRRAARASALCQPRGASSR